MGWIFEMILESLIEPLLGLAILIFRSIGFPLVYWFIKIFNTSKSESQIWKEQATTSACIGFLILVGLSFLYVNYK